MPDDSSGSPEHKAQFSRTVDMLGPEGWRRLSEAFVIIAGLGGVGSHAAMSLARSGVGKLRLIDFDGVTWSSLNRHAVAMPGDVGRPKVQVVAEHITALNPQITLEARETFFDREAASEALSGAPEMVIDAIDSLNPKVSLLRACVERRLRVISSMGASSRTDPTKVRIGPLESTEVCPLAKQVRKRMRRLGLSGQGEITAVYSVEPGRPALPPDESEERYPRGRIRNRLPSLATIPGVFGYALASVAIAELSGTLFPRE